MKCLLTCLLACGGGGVVEREERDCCCVVLKRRFLVVKRLLLVFRRCNWLIRSKKSVDLRSGLPTMRHGILYVTMRRGYTVNDACWLWWWWCLVLCFSFAKQTNRSKQAIGWTSSSERTNESFRYTTVPKSRVARHTSKLGTVLHPLFSIIIVCHDVFMTILWGRVGLTWAWRGPDAVCARNGITSTICIAASIMPCHGGFSLLLLLFCFFANQQSKQLTRDRQNARMAEQTSKSPK